MFLLFLLLVALLITQIGFWETLAALLGAVVMIVLLAILTVALLITGGVLWARRRLDSVTRRLR
jgi:hypothetical protein